MSDDVSMFPPPEGTNRAKDPGQPDRHRFRHPIDQEELIRRRLESCRCDPNASGVLWLLALIPAMVEAIDSGEWCGSPDLLARYLKATFGPIPSSLAEPVTLTVMLDRARPTLQAWGYDIRIESLPYGGEVVSIFGTSGQMPG